MGYTLEKAPLVQSRFYASYDPARKQSLAHSCTLPLLYPLFLPPSQDLCLWLILLEVSNLMGLQAPCAGGVWPAKMLPFFHQKSFHFLTQDRPISRTPHDKVLRATGYGGHASPGESEFRNWALFFFFL